MHLKTQAEDPNWKTERTMRLRAGDETRTAQERSSNTTSTVGRIIKEKEQRQLLAKNYFYFPKFPGSARQHYGSGEGAKALLTLARIVASRWTNATAPPGSGPRPSCRGIHEIHEIHGRRCISGQGNSGQKATLELSRRPGHAFARP
jgi:hypothetical protein